jgi:hypothetical protein
MCRLPPSGRLRIDHAIDTIDAGSDFHPVA